MIERYPDRPLAQPTLRPVRNRRSGHPAERWVLKKQRTRKSIRVGSMQEMANTVQVVVLFAILHVQFVFLV